jgi:hypothetical protein
MAKEHVVDVRGDGIRVHEHTGDVGVAEARQRFGGIDLPATLAGTLAALGLTALLGGVLSAAGRYGYQLGRDDAVDELTVAGLVAGLVTLVLAFLVGGWVAGRMARYDGGRNGIVTALWFLALAAIASGLGAWLGSEYDVFDKMNLPQPFSTDALTVGAIVSGLVALALVLAAAWWGGRLGERYHRRADELIVHTREGGIVAGAVR